MKKSDFQVWLGKWGRDEQDVEVRTDACGNTCLVTYRREAGSSPFENVLVIDNHPLLTGAAH